MALFKQAEFAQKCKIDQAYLTMYRKRGKVFVSEDGMVDDAHPMNILFYEKCMTRKPKPEKEKVEKTRGSEKQVVEKTKTAKMKRFPDKTPGTSAKFDERFDLDTEKRKMEIEKLQREPRNEEVKHQKALGRLVPTDPVKSLFIQTIKSYTMGFKQAADKIILEFGKRNKMNRNDMAEMRGELIAAINKAAEDSIAESKKGVVHIVREYSQAQKG